MRLVAVSWHIYLLTNSAIALGLMGLIRFMPIVVFSLIGGSFADVFNRKKLIIATQASLGIITFLLAITTFTKTVNPTIIYILTMLYAVSISFDAPARQALIPNLVDKNHLANAMSFNLIMFQTSTIIGPLASGFLIANYNVGIAYAISSLSYLMVIMLMLFINAPTKIDGKLKTLSFNSVREGILYVKSKTIIWSTMLLDFFTTFFASVNALFPIFAKDILHVGPKGLGILYAAPPVGAVLAGLVVAHMGTLQKQGRVLLLSIFFYAISVIIFGLSKSFVLSIIALLIVGAGDSISTIIRNTIRQLATPDYIRGRMTSINMIFFMGGPTLGEFQAGFLAAYLGAPLTVAVGGLATLVVVSVMALSVPILRRYNNHLTTR